MKLLRTTLWGALCLCQCSPRAEPAIQASPACDALPTDIAAVSVPAPESELGVALSSPLSALIQALERQVPQTLAQGRNQTIGTAGRVTFKVERDALRVSVQPQDVWLTTTLRGAINVCKPVGPFCVNYGSCQPAWTVRARVPTNFELDAQLRAELNVTLHKGCVLSPVGYDATAELERITRSEIRNVRRRVQTELTHAQRQLEHNWRQLQQPQRLSSDLCLRFEPSALSYEGPQQAANGEVTLRISARGRVLPDCAPAKQPFTWKPRRHDGLAPQVLLRTSVHWPLADFEAQLASALGQDIALRVVGPTATPPTASPSASDTQGSASNRLYVGLPHDTGCRDWVHVRASVQSSRVRLEAVNGGALEQATLDAAVVHVPPQVALLQQQLDHLPALWDNSRQQAQQQGVLLDDATQTRVDVVVDAAGLQFWPTLHGSLSASFQPDVAR